MESRVLKAVAFSIILLEFFVGCTNRRTWNYELLSFSAASSDQSQLNISGKVGRVGRYEYSLSIVFDWQFDTDDNTMLEVNFYTSQSGSETDFTELPHKVPIILFNEFMDEHYNDLIYKNFESCSNLPKMSGKFKSPYPRNTYILNRCMPDGHGMPLNLPPAYYKIVCKMIGKVEMKLVLNARITSKLL